MNTLKIIEGQREGFDEIAEAIDDFGSNVKDDLFNWHKQSIIQILEAEVERKMVIKKDEDKIDVPQGSNIGEYRFVENLKRKGFNEALEEDIAHLTDIINKLK